MITELKYGQIDENFTVSAKNQLVIPDVYSSEVLLQGLQTHGDATILIDAETDEQLSGKELLSRSLQVAHVLRDIGVGNRVFCFCVDSALYAT
jgi:non-ribosomal peptide synthetase component F